MRRGGRLGEGDRAADDPAGAEGREVRGARAGGKEARVLEGRAPEGGRAAVGDLAPVGNRTPAEDPAADGSADRDRDRQVLRGVFVPGGFEGIQNHPVFKKKACKLASIV